MGKGENKKLHIIGKDLVDEILSGRYAADVYGCGCGNGSGSGGWQPHGCGSGTSCGSGLGIPVTNHPYKGIYFSENVMANDALATQLTELLYSSQILRNVLTPYVEGHSKLTINLEDIPNDENNNMVAMDTSNATNTITINSKMVNESGFYYSFEGKDKSSGHQFNGTVDDTFSSAFTHEALHAKHYYWYHQSWINGKNDGERAEYLQNRGFSDEFVDVFYPQTAEGRDHNDFGTIKGSRSMII